MHVMIDLETMGTRPTAPIVAIGAVAFDEDGLYDQFYRVVDLCSSARAGAVIEAGTVMWWLRQSDEARAALQDQPVYLAEALSAFKDWLYSRQVKGVWGNGASFDNVVLAEAYRRMEMPCPWPFWKDRCYRTVKAMHPDIQLQRHGVAHNALDDARDQAMHLIAIWAGESA